MTLEEYMNLKEGDFIRYYEDFRYKYVLDEQITIPYKRDIIFKVLSSSIFYLARFIQLRVVVIMKGECDEPFNSAWEIGYEDNFVLADDYQNTIIKCITKL